MSKDNWLNPLNSISQVYSEQIASQTKKELKDLEKGIKKLSDKDIAKADKVAEVGEDKDWGYDKDGNSLNPVDIEKRKRKEDDLFGSPNKKKKAVKNEGLYNWRDELREIADDIPMTDKESETKVKERKVNNKVIINPKMSEAFEGIGGSVLAVGEFDTVEAAVEYFYEEGINEEGLDQIIEEVGLEEFVEFITESAVELNEERAARKARASAPSY